MYKYTRGELETIILFNEDDDYATVETPNGRLLRRLEQMREKGIAEFISDDGAYGVYRIPKRKIMFSAKTGGSNGFKKKNDDEDENE